MRKLATLQQVEKLTPIPKADRIELAHIKGWQVVVGKGLYKVGDWLVYHEIDSFMLEGHEPYHSDLQARGTKLCQLETGEVVKGYVIRTIKLRGEISQGYCVPFSSYSEDVQKELNRKLEQDRDVTELLQVYKFEKPETSGEKEEARQKPPKGKFNKFKWLARQWLERNFPSIFKSSKFKANFPSFLHKSECIRAQNCKHRLWDAYQTDELFEVSVKLDGSSITVFNYKKDKGTCSRNLRKSPKNTADKFITTGEVIHNIMKASSYTKDYCFQGELLDTNIQGNFEGVSHPVIYVYSMWSCESQVYLNPENVKDICKEYGIKYVPVLHESVTLSQLFPGCSDEDELLARMLKYAEGPSSLNGKYREGLVYKSLKDGYSSIKTISNQYLLNQSID